MVKGNNIADEEAGLASAHQANDRPNRTREKLASGDFLFLDTEDGLRFPFPLPTNLPTNLGDPPKSGEKKKKSETEKRTSHSPS